MGILRSRSRCWPARTLAMLSVGALAHASTAGAAIYKVGTGSQLCDAATIDAAVAAAEAHPGPDEIRLTRTLSYAGKHIVVNTSQDLTIVGGFASCTSTLPDTSKTEIDMTTGANFPVVSINNTATSTVKLRLLRLTGGTATNGGGIYFLGGGTLEMSFMAIDNNEASNGGGIYFQGNSGSAKLIIGEKTLINSNIANASGGGIFLRNGEMTMTAPGSSLFANIAAQYGGGLRMYDGPAGTKADVGSNGYFSLATIGSNEARIGGGVSVQGLVNAGTGRVTFTLLPGADISSNYASERGGAIDIQNYHGFGDFGDADGFVYGGILDSNIAPQAAAVYVGHDDDGLGDPRGSYFRMTDGAIIGNQTLNSNNVQTGGGVIVVSELARAEVSRTIIQDNVAGTVLRADASDAAVTVSLNHSLVTNNTMVRGIVESLNGAPINIFGSTITNNTMSGNVVIAVDDKMQLKQSIVWQPGKQTAQINGLRDIDDVIASELASLINSPSVIYANPRFIDPGHDDYHLQAASPAVDFAGVIDTNGVDGKKHNKDMALVANRYGVGDIGAYELQSIGNLVLDPEFDVDLRLWSVVTAGVSSWVSAGASSAGSVTIAKTPVAGGGLIGLSQCVHIPGPGVYKLTGFTHGGVEINNVFRDSANLGWKLRYSSGNESCTGTVNAESEVVFPKSATFVAPTAAGLIDVPRGTWTRYTTVEISLIVREGDTNPNGTTSGSFDGIVLQAIDSDQIFADDFDL